METAITLASVPAVLAIVNLMKSFGVKGKYAALAAVAVGVVLNLAVELAGQSPAFQAAATGLILGLSAAGLYDATNTTPAALEAVDTENY